jgi:hypothetical protein
LVSDLLAVILVGILSNAALTGILSVPLNRYGGRVIWLLPFFVVLYLGRLGLARETNVKSCPLDQMFASDRGGPSLDMQNVDGCAG